MSERDFEPVSAWRRYPKHFCVACGEKANSHVSNVGFTCSEHYEPILMDECDTHGQSMGRSRLRYPWRSEFAFLKHRAISLFRDEDA